MAFYVAGTLKFVAVCLAFKFWRFCNHNNNGKELTKRSRNKSDVFLFVESVQSNKRYLHYRFEIAMSYFHCLRSSHTLGYRRYLDVHLYSPIIGDNSALYAAIKIHVKKTYGVIDITYICFTYNRFYITVSGVLKCKL